MSDLLNYDCPPYDLSLSATACARMKAMAVEAANHPKREGSQSVLLSKRSCVNCCGVVELARMWGRIPHEIEVKPRETFTHKGASRTKPPIARSLGAASSLPQDAIRRGMISLAEIARRLGIASGSALGKLRAAKIRSVRGARVGELLYVASVVEPWIAGKLRGRRIA